VVEIFPMEWRELDGGRCSRRRFVQNCG
jgi:hypothetical protein